MTTILSICQDAATELSLSEPGTLFGDSATDEGGKLLRQLTRTCRALAARFDWQKLRREHTFTTVATEAQTSATPIPTDFLRFLEGTVWNRTTTWQVVGPLDAVTWQSEKANLSTRAQPAFMIRNGLWLMTPTPTAGDTIAYEYITKYIGYDGSSTERTAFSADDDEAYFDDEALILGVVWRYRKAEGWDYSEEFREYEMQVYNVYKMDGGRSKLDMRGPHQRRHPAPPQTPDIISSVGGDGGSF